MRIAISGSHRSGKSTLVEELSALLPRYRTVDEPYYLLLEDGYEFSHPPSLEDFEAQLERALEELGDEGPDVLFDRCPIDFVGYISAHDDADAFDLDAWAPRIRAAVQTLDLIVLVPIEEPDRIALSASDAADETRALVDEKLKQLLLEDALELGVEVIPAEGKLADRVKLVMLRIRHAP